MRPSNGFGLGAERLEEHVAGPVADRSYRAFRRLGEPVPLGTRRRVAQLPQLLVDRERHQLVPAVQDVEHEATREVDAEPERVGQRQREHAPAPLGGDVAARELVLHVVPVLRVHLQQVPVERPVGGGAHVAHQLERLARELAHLRDELERRAGELTDDAAQLDELVARRVSRRDGDARVVVVRRRPRRREPHPTGRDPEAQQALHLVELGGCRLARRRVVVHHDAAQRRMADEEAGVRHQRAVEPIEVLLGRGPVPRHALLERLQRHALDAGQHPHQVVGIRRVDRPVTRGERRDREPAVATHHGCHSVQRRRAQRRVPERLGVVVGVDVDEARARRPDRSRRSSAPRRRRRSCRSTVIRPSSIGHVGPPRRPNPCRRRPCRRE